MKPVTYADVEGAMQKLKENNGKQNKLPACLNRLFLGDVKARQWFRFVMTGIMPEWMEEQ